MVGYILNIRTKPLNGAICIKYVNTTKRNIWPTSIKVLFLSTLSRFSPRFLSRNENFKHLLTLISELTSYLQFPEYDHPLNSVIFLLQQKFLTELRGFPEDWHVQSLIFHKFRNYPIIDSRFEGINEILAISFKMEAMKELTIVIT